MNLIKKAVADYRELGTATRLIIRITFIIVLLFCFLYIAAFTMPQSDGKYLMLLITDDLLSALRSITGIGFLGTIISGTIEGFNC